MNDIENIFSFFRVSSPMLEASPLGNGHINTTFLIIDKKYKKYVLQKINNYAFKDIGALMNNIYLVTDYLSKIGYETLTPIFTKEDKLYYLYEGEYYRLYKYVDNTVCLDSVSDSKSIRNVAKAFGKLHKALNEFDASLLSEIIPHFHDTAFRYGGFLQSLIEDPCNRKETCLEEIENIKKYDRYFPLIRDGIKKGSIHLAVTHNDPKCNNVLFDKYTGEIRTVVDLDTIMPGSYLYDFGDAIRSLLTGDYEDSKDLSKIVINPKIYEVYRDAYLSEMEMVLTRREIELLPFSVFLMAIELSMRFLKDYLDGDLYFGTKYEDHNLIRARTQLRLANILFDYFHLDKLSLK